MHPQNLSQKRRPLGWSTIPTLIGLFGGVLLLNPLNSAAVVVGPYTPDANTVFLFHLDEAAGTTVATNAAGAIAAGTNALAYVQNQAVTNNCPADTSILGAGGASGFLLANFGRCAVVTNSAGLASSSGTVSNGLGVDFNQSGAFTYYNNSANVGDTLPNQNLILGPNNSFTLEALINLSITNTASGTGREIICSDNGGTRGFQFRINGANIEFNSQPGVGPTANDVLVPIPFSGPHAFVPNKWFHIALTHSDTPVAGGTNTVFYWTSLDDGFTNANAISTNLTATINPASQLAVVIGNEGRINGGSSEGLRGYIDEVRISKTARPANQMMFTDGSITVGLQPQPQVVLPGGTARFTVTASSPVQPLGYQWRANGVDLVDGGDFSGSTTPTLTIANAQASYEANYDCVITNLLKTNITTAASLIVHAPLNLSWLGTTSAFWDTTSSNWFDTVALVDSTFTSGDFVTFDDSGSNSSPVTLTAAVLPGSVTVNSTLAYTLAGAGKVSGSTGLMKTNSGTLTILTTNDYTGSTYLGGGTVSVPLLTSGLLASPLGAASSASSNLVFDGGDLQYTGPTVSIDRGATLNAGGGTVEITSATSTLTLSGSIRGTSGGNLTKAGNGTLLLTGANSFDGATTISAGNLQVGNGGAAGSLSVGAVTNNAALTFNRSDSFSVANSITGSGNLTNNGSGTLTLAGTNSYDGLTVANSGTLTLDNSGALGNSSSVLVTSTTGGALGGTRVAMNSGVVTPSSTSLSLPSSGSTVRSTLYANGPSAWSGPITLNGDGTIAFGSGGGFLTVSGAINSPGFTGILQLRGTGVNGFGGAVDGVVNLGAASTVQVHDGTTWTVNSVGNAWGSSQIALGTLALGQNNALPAGATVRLGAVGPAALDLAGFNQQIGGLVTEGSVTNGTIGNSSTLSDSTLIVSSASPSSFGGIIKDVLGSGTHKLNLAVVGNTLTLSNANTYSGTTTVSGGTLALGGGGSISDSSFINLSAGSVLDVSTRTDATFTVPVSQTLAGNGTVKGTNLVLNGSIMPGNDGIGTLSCSGALTVNGGSSLNWGIDDAAGTEGADPGWGLVNVASNLSFSASPANPFVINVATFTPLGAPGPAANFDPSAGYTWRLIKGALPVSGFDPTALLLNTNGFANSTANGSGFGVFALNQDANDLLLTFTGFPAITAQPASAAANPGDSVTLAATATGGFLTYQWFKNGVELAGFNGPSITLNNIQLADAASYYLVVSNAAGLVTSTTAALTLNQIITFGSLADITYGDAAPALNASSSSGLPVSFTVVSGPATLSGNALSITGVGQVVVKASQAGSTFINPAPDVTQSFNVNAKLLTVTADNQTRVYGAPNPTLTFTYSGFVSGENSSVLSGEPAISTSADVNSSVAGGPYAITISQGTLTAANYTFQFVNGLLTVTAAGSTLQVGSSANPSQLGDSVTLTATVAPLAPSAGTPTGSIQVLTNGVAAGAPIPIVNLQASLATSLLAGGTNIVSFNYPGDDNFVGSTNTLAQIVNRPPVANVALFFRAKGASLQIAIADLLTNASDPDGDVLTLASVSTTSTNGATITTNATTITYDPPSTNGDVADSFDYTVSDGRGGSATGTVQVLIIPDQLCLGVTLLSDGNVELSLSGTPGTSYHVQATEDLTPPSVWNTLAGSGTNAPTLGIWTFDDLDATNHTARFYRTVSP